jgi:hypothetical protein
MHYSENNPEDGGPIRLLLNIGTGSGSKSSKCSSAPANIVPDLAGNDLSSLSIKRGFEYCRLDARSEACGTKAADWKYKEAVEKIEEKTEAFLERNEDQLDKMANMLVENRRERMKKWSPDKTQVCISDRLCRIPLTYLEILPTHPLRSL